MKNLSIFWFRILRFIKFVFKKFEGDNIFIEKLINKCRIKLKEDFGNKELKIIDWLVNFMHNLNVIPQSQLTDMSKKYYEMINNSSDKSVDMLCDYLIIMYNSNF